MAWAEVAPETCGACGEHYVGSSTLVGWDPGSPGHRVYHCANCGHATRVPADQIRLRRVRNRPLTSAQESSAKHAARRAAREARSSLRTARGQYRRYRAVAGAAYLDWPRWHGEYLNEYRGGGGINERGMQVGTNVPGDAI